MASSHAAPWDGRPEVNTVWNLVFQPCRVRRTTIRELSVFSSCRGAAHTLPRQLSTKRTVNSPTAPSQNPSARWWSHGFVAPTDRRYRATSAWPVFLSGASSSASDNAVVGNLRLSRSRSAPASTRTRAISRCPSDAAAMSGGLGAVTAPSAGAPRDISAFKISTRPSPAAFTIGLLPHSSRARASAPASRSTSEHSRLCTAA